MIETSRRLCFLCNHKVPKAENFYLHMRRCQERRFEVKEWYI